MRARIIAAAALAAVLSVHGAGAQDDAPISADTPGITSPVRIIGSEDTEFQYPLESVLMEDEGVAGVTYTINADGTTSDVTVTETSHHPRLDQASVKMVQGWKYVPAMQDGKPIALSTKADIKWILNPHARDMKMSYPPIVMTQQDYPPGAWDRHEEGTDQVGLIVDRDGNVSSFELEVSSGYADLDAAAEDALTKHRHLTPASVDGKPVRGWIEVRVVWSTKPQDGEQ